MKNLALFHEIAENPYNYAKKVKKGGFEEGLYLESITYFDEMKS